MPTRTNRPFEENLPHYGVLVIESHHAEDFVMSFRSHEFAKIVYVLDGRGELETSAIRKPFQPGDVIVVPPRTRHRISDAENAPSSLYVACLSLSLLAFDRRLSQRFRLMVLPDPHLSTRVASTMRRMVYRQALRSDTTSLTIVADALHLIESVLEPRSLRRAKANRKGEGDTEVMARYVRQLRDNFFEASTINHAADELGMSRRQFTKLFAKETGTTWLRFVRRHAINHAMTKLRETDLPIASVAFECGFNDLTTFYRQFKSHSGLAPAQYRIRHQPGSEQISEPS